MAQKLDIFDLLKAVDKHDLGFLDRQTPELKKAFTPVPVLRWLSAVSDCDVSDYMLISVNERVNLDMFSLSKHPELIYKLMASCGVGSPQKHQWIPMPKQRKLPTLVHEFIAKYHEQANDLEIAIIVDKMTREDFEEFLNGTGTTDENRKPLIAAFDKLRGTVIEEEPKKRKRK